MAVSVMDLFVYIDILPWTNLQDSILCRKPVLYGALQKSKR